MKNELDKIESKLDEYGVPQEVAIGKDSTSDRIEWLIRRIKNLEKERKKEK